MVALTTYLEKDRELSRCAPGTTEHATLLEYLNYLRCKLTDEGKTIVERADKGKWIKVGDRIACPLCGSTIKSSGAPVRCMACMRDVIPEVIK